jgi:hypothetical protein
LYEISVRKPEGKRSLGRNNGGWKENIRMDFRDIVLAGLTELE